MKNNNNKIMTLNIQLFAKAKGNDTEEKEKEPEEVNQADRIAELTINLDLEIEKKEELEQKLSELQKKYDDEHKANMRLMDRISKREELKEKEIEDHKSKNASILDLYDFSSGKLTIKR